MHILTGQEAENALEYIRTAAEVASQATCQRSKCGALLVKDSTIIGTGYNSPPAGNESQRRCTVDKLTIHPKITDKTCCVHAEQRAIMNALASNSELITGSCMYFIRLNESGTIEPAGKPYCTICSKMALDAGVSEWVLWHKEGITVYGAEEYNQLSYQFQP